MAKWDSLIYTSAGLKMIADAVAGNQITFTRAVSSTDDHSADSDETIAKLTSIATEAQSVDVSRVTKLSDTEDKVYATFPTRTVTTAYKMRTVGLYAKLQNDSKETLFGVGISTEPDYVAAGAVDGTDANINLSFIIGVSSTDQVAITINSDGMVTEKELTDELTFKADDAKVVHDNHDGTITANGTTFTPADSETVAQLRTDFDTLDVGGVNLIQGTSRNTLNVLVPDGHKEFLTKPLVDESLPHSQYYSCRIWFQLPDVDMYVGLHLAGNGGTETVTGSIVKAGTSGYSQIKLKMKDGQFPYQSFVQTVGDVGGFYLTYKRYSVEAGTKFTDWSPAPDEMASKDDVTTGMNQANAYTDSSIEAGTKELKQRISVGPSELLVCLKGNDFGALVMSNSIPVGFSMVRDGNTACNVMVYKESSDFGWAMAIQTYKNQFPNIASWFNGVWSGWNGVRTYQQPYITATTNLDNLNPEGEYQYSADKINFVNGPKIMAGQPGWGHVSCFTGGGVNFQRIYNNNNVVYQRAKSGTPAVFSPWVIFTSTPA